MQIDISLSRREATLRAAATACLSGIALVQAIALPNLLANARALALLSAGAMAACVALGLALAAAPAGVGQRVWRAVAATAALVLAGWLATRVFTVPGFPRHSGWAALPGTAAAVPAAAGLVLATLALRPTRAAWRGLAATAAVTLALAPGVGALVVALGPGPSGGETALAAPGHTHVNGENDLRFVPGSGRDGGHFVVKVAATPGQSALGLGLLGAATLVFTYGAIGYLRRRAAPAGHVARPGVESLA